ncbi:Autophagy-related protein 7 [Ectocarpus siliculosus]|uniref:Autophagy-related protein 7 n=1 Tax=Ectocarpus siliculosus TaxID=2880 RepID=D7FNV8_ECTSI|nr:Autophagy-related protein 7 [Ectocarpus siliculosus]|eukprot:CBJ30234.1 Autophagy-related protein 7 [Ectocarpus siliculosus]
MTSTTGPGDALKFVAFSSLVKVEFWTELATKKLDTYRLNDDAQPIYGFYGSGHDARTPCRLNLLGESSFDSPDDEGRRAAGPGARFEECRAIGYVKNVNTKEAFKELDKPAALAAIARETWADAVESDRAVAEPELLLRFLLLTFADLKKSAFLHWFAFPTLGSQALFRLVSSRPASAAAPGVLLGGPADAASVVRGLAGLWARSVEGTGRPHCPPFFVVVKDPRPGGRDDGDGEEAVAAGLRVLSLLEFERERTGGEVGDDTVVFGFVDPCSEPGGMPGWPLRNFLVLLSARQEHITRPSPVRHPRHAGGAAAHTTGGGPSLLGRSVVLDIDLSAAPSVSGGPGEAAAAVKAAWLPARVGSLGWEPNAAGRPGPRMSDLSSVLDPARLAENSVRLNIKLMRWRALPELDVELLAETKCLLLGAGTLGCAVARCLMGWGIQHITFADNGRVAYSNPVRQSLFAFEDCKGGGRFKAEAAAAALSAVYPGARSSGHVLTIPMPGHPLTTPAEASRARRDAETLEELVSSHDVVFVLTDSRESRWLPTLLAAKHDKICVNAALGLDSFLVVRHGGSPDDGEGGETLKEDNGRKRQAEAPAVGAAASPSQMAEKVESGKPQASAASAAAASSPEARKPESEPTAPSCPPGTDATTVATAAAAASAAVRRATPSRLGCYFCTDVVAPENSSLNRTLDQQCTVTRPGLAPMAAATAVEMTVGLLHHPLRQRAPADDSAGRARGLGAAQAAAAAAAGQGGGHPLGALPHQVRGFIASFTTVTPSALAFDRCTACSKPVVAAHRSQGWGFVERACQSPSVLEEVSGLEEMRKGLDALDVDLDWGVGDEWEEEDDDNDDDDVDKKEA